MSSTLYVVLASGRPLATGGLQYALSSNGLDVAQEGVGTAATLPRADSTVAVVPPDAISWHWVKIPPVGASRLRATLDGLLEDRLLDEPSTCAMALSPHAAVDGYRNVATMDKGWLIRCIAQLEQDGRSVSRCLPQYWPVGEARESQRVLLDDANGLRIVVVGQQAVVVGPLSAASVFLRSDDVNSSSQPVYHDATSGKQAGVELPCAAEPRSVAQQLVAIAASGWELAQFDLAISRHGRMVRRWGTVLRAGWSARQWRAMRWGVLALLLANLVGLNFWAWQLDQQARAKKSEIEAVFLRAFPGVKTVVDAPRQMEREIAQLRRTSGGLGVNDMEVMVSALGQSLPGAQVATSIDFAAGELLVGGLALDPTVLAGLSAKLSAAGYSARMAGERLRVVVDGRP